MFVSVRAVSETADHEVVNHCEFVTPINSLNCFMKFLSSLENFPDKLELRDEGTYVGA